MRYQQLSYKRGQLPIHLAVLTGMAMIYMFTEVVPTVQAASDSIAGSAAPDPALIQKLHEKTAETARLRERVKELEALLRKKNEISEAKSMMIEELGQKQKK